MDVHEYDGRFQGDAAHFKVTSVIGHVLSIDFPAKYQSWETTEPSSLFDAPTIKSEANPKVRKASKAGKAEQAKLSYLSSNFKAHSRL